MSYGITALGIQGTVKDVGFLARLRWLVSKSIKTVIGWLAVLYNSILPVHVAGVLRLEIS